MNISAPHEDARGVHVKGGTTDAAADFPSTVNLDDCVIRKIGGAGLWVVGGECSFATIGGARSSKVVEETSGRGSSRGEPDLTSLLKPVGEAVKPVKGGGVKSILEGLDGLDDIPEESAALSSFLCRGIASGAGSGAEEPSSSDGTAYSEFSEDESYDSRERVPSGSSATTATTLAKPSVLPPFGAKDSSGVVPREVREPGGGASSSALAATAATGKSSKSKWQQAVSAASRSANKDKESKTSTFGKEQSKTSALPEGEGGGFGFLATTTLTLQARAKAVPGAFKNAHQDRGRTSTKLDRTSGGPRPPPGMMIDGGDGPSGGDGALAIML